MPWSPGDGPARHTHKANTPAKKKQWATVANKVLADSNDEGKAVRIANAAVAKHEFSAHEEKTMRRSSRREREGAA